MMKHKKLTPAYARELYTRHTMMEIMAAYQVEFWELFYMLYHGELMPCKN